MATSGEKVTATFPATQNVRIEDGVGATLATVTAANALKVDGSAVVQPVSLPAITAANILDGFATATAVTAATTLITIPAGRTWIGVLSIQCATTLEAGTTTDRQITGVLSTAGAGVTPSGNQLQCDAIAGAGTAAGTIGGQATAFNQTVRMVVIAPGGNSVTVQWAVPTATGNTKVANFSAKGELQ